MAFTGSAETLASWRAQRDRLIASATARKHSTDEAFRHEVCRALQVGVSASNDKLLAALDAAVAPHAQEAPKMGTKLTLTPELRSRLGLSESATADETVAAINRELAATRRERLAAADRSGAITEDALYESLYPSARTPSTDPTDGLSAEDAAAYRAVWADDDASSSPGDDDALLRELWPEG